MTPPETFRPQDVAAGVRANGRRFPGKAAVRMGEATLTYGALVERMNRVTHLAAAAGIGPGVNAAIMSGNRPEYFEIVAGVAATGGAVATVNPRQTPAELGAIARDCDARLIFADPAFADAIRAADLPAGCEVLTLGAPSEDDLAAIAPAGVLRDAAAALPPRLKGRRGVPPPGALALL